jgi:hypothetical protein
VGQLASTYAALHREAANWPATFGRWQPRGGRRSQHHDPAAQDARDLLSERARALRNTSTRFHRVDEWIADRCEQAAHEHLQVGRTEMPTIDDYYAQFMHRVREPFVRIAPPLKTDLAARVREQLRPPPASASPPPAPATATGAERGDHAPTSAALGNLGL